MSPSKAQVIKEDTFPSFGDKQQLFVINGAHAHLGMAPIPEFNGFETAGVTCFVIHDTYCEIGKGPMKKVLAVGPDSGKLLLADFNAADKHQEWVQLSNYGSINGEGQGKFALVNIATGLAISRSRSELGGPYCQVSLVSFESISRYQDGSALWKKGGKQGFGRIHAATDVECYLDVDDSNNVVLRKDKRSRFPLKFGGSSGKVWKIMPLP